MNTIERVIQKKGDAPYLRIDDFTAIEACGVYKGYGYITSINCKGYRQAYLELPNDCPFSTLEQVIEIIDEKMVGFVSNECLVKNLLDIKGEDIWVGIYGPLYEGGVARQTARQIFNEHYMTIDYLPSALKYSEEISVYYMEVLCRECIEKLISGEPMRERNKTLTLREKLQTIEEANEIISAVTYLKSVISENDCTEHTQRCVKAIDILSKFVHEDLVRRVGQLDMG